MILKIFQLHQNQGCIPNLLLPILPIFLVAFMAWVIARYLEPVLKIVIKIILYVASNYFQKTQKMIFA